ncbi:MAG: 30S ribosomal protein S15 [Candidatus Bathyarchaeota archaeon]|nr:30S ribosomal protein S15 [Candidatus Bathyarchaeota archaeon]
MAPKGKSHSRRPVSKRAPSWCRYSPEEAEAFVIQLAKEDYPPSQIGILLRDQYGIPLIKYLTGKSITEIMESAGVSLELPEDLQNLLQKAKRLQIHMARNKKDNVNKHSLELVTSKVRRLANYYRDRSVLPKDWKYTS